MSPVHGLSRGGDIGADSRRSRSAPAGRRRCPLASRSLRSHHSRVEQKRNTVLPFYAVRIRDLIAPRAVIEAQFSINGEAFIILC